MPTPTEAEETKRIKKFFEEREKAEEIAKNKINQFLKEDKISAALEILQPPIYDDYHGGRFLDIISSHVQARTEQLLKANEIEKALDGLKLLFKFVRQKKDFYL